MLVAAAGAMLVALGMTVARRGAFHADLLFWVGLWIIFVPIATRLASIAPSRHERIALLVGLGLWLYLVKVLHSPVGFTFFDELLHWRTATDIVRSGRLFGENPLLPVSPYYPGLESATLSLAQPAGLSIYEGGILLLALARALSMLALFLLYERLSASPRLASLATLVYVTNPAFMFFDKQFAYESLGLPLAFLLLWIELRRQREPTSSRRVLAVIGALVLAAVIITHHLTSYALSAFMVLWSGTWLWLRRKHRGGAGPVWLAIAAILGTASWLLAVARVTIAYLGGNLITTLREIVGLIAGETAVRRLFHGFAGDVAPLWERLAGYGAVLGVMIVLPFGLWVVWRRYRHDALALALAIGALAFPVAQMLRFTPFGLQIVGRTPEFLFLPLGFVLAAALLDSNTTPRLRRHIETWFPGRETLVMRVVFVLWITTLFTGGVILGWPRWGRMPGPYLVVADSRSIEPQGIAAARWAHLVLEPRQRIAADRINALLMLAYGRHDPVTASFGGVNVPELFFVDSIGPSERAMIRQGAIRYVIIDRRIATDRPSAGVYFEPGERSLDQITVPVGLGLLIELDTLPEVRRIMDSGDIIIFDTGALASGP
jgi:hypothetical protein